jgi:GT2 family glycosyltransferase
MSLTLTPSISVIVPVHNGGSGFARCLASLRAAEPSPEEIIVVADGDADGSWRLAEELGMEVLRIPTPGGPARARNLGAQKARGAILFFVDADVTVPRDAVSRIAALFERDPDLTAAIGSYDDTPGETNFLSQYKNLFHHYVHQTSKPEASTFWGACGAIRREIFLSTGGFNEEYQHPCIEDIELGYRLKRAGFKIHLAKELQVKHLKRWDIGSLVKTDFFYRALPWTALILSGKGLINDLNIKTSSRISVTTAYVLLLTLLGALYLPWFLVFSVLSVVVLIGLNWDLYSFFRKKRGVAFAVKTIPWHWFYLLYSGLAFAIGLASWQMKRLGTRIRAFALRCSP